MREYLRLLLALVAIAQLSQVNAQTYMPGYTPGYTTGYTPGYTPGYTSGYSPAYSGANYMPSYDSKVVTVPFTYPMWPSFDMLYSHDAETPADLKKKLLELEAKFAASSDREGRIDCPNVVQPKCDPHYWFRQADGSCNNLNITWWGQSGTIYKRIREPAYQDFRNSPRSLGVDGRPLKSAREVANKVHYPSDYYKDLTHLLPVFGQFVVHDLVRSSHTVNDEGEVRQCTCGSKHPDCLTIPIPKDDYQFKDKSCLIQIREADGRQLFTCDIPYRAQLNEVNSWVDLSQVYGNNQEEESSLRAYYGGRLEVSYFKDSPGAMLPSSCPFTAYKMVKKTGVCFHAGDSRVNQYPLLTAMHTLWVREHNRIAGELAKINPHWDDERLFQETKRILGAIYQNIVYWEWLPLIIGNDLAKIFDLTQAQTNKYFTGYDEGVFPNVASEFAAAAARFGHTLMRSYVTKADDYYRPVYNESLREHMFRPDYLVKGYGLDEYLRGAMIDMCDQNSPHVNDELSNWLIHDLGNYNPSQFFSLPAFNIMRGREFGLQSYAHYRELAGLNFPKSFDDLSWISPKLIKKLKSVYKNVLDIDLWTGALAEQHVIGGVVGPTFAYIIARGFRDWKFGDRWFYENPQGVSPYAFTPYQLNSIRQVKLNSVLCNNIHIKDTTYNVFLKPDKLKNPFISCSSVYQLDLNLFREAPNTYGSTYGGSYDSSAAYSSADTMPYNKPPVYYYNGGYSADKTNYDSTNTYAYTASMPAATS